MNFYKSKKALLQQKYSTETTNYSTKSNCKNNKKKIKI